MQYEIQRINPAKSGIHPRWSRAWGYHRSIIHAKSDAAAINDFRRETANSSGPMRLIRWHADMKQYTVVVDNGLTPPNPSVLAHSGHQPSFPNEVRSGYSHI